MRWWIQLNKVTPLLSDMAQFPTFAWSIASSPLFYVSTEWKIQINIDFPCSSLEFNSVYIYRALVGS